MTRSVWKMPFSSSKIFKTLFFLKKNSPILLKSSNYIIFPSFVGHTFSVYNGKNYVLLFVNNNMVGFKFKDFFITKKK